MRSYFPLGLGGMNVVRGYRFAGIYVRFLCLIVLGSGFLAEAEQIYAVVNQNTVGIFNTQSPGTLISEAPLSNPTRYGAATLAVLPATGQLYSIDEFNVDAVNALTGSESVIVHLPSNLLDYPLGAAFQPGTTNLFVMSFNGDLTSINVATGVVTQLGSAVFAPGGINSGSTGILEGITWASSPVTGEPTLYAVSPNFGLLQLNPANAEATTVAPMPIFADAGSGAGFTYSTATGTAYLSLFYGPLGGGNALFSVNLQSGQTNLIGPLGFASESELEIAAADTPAPEPTTFFLVMAAGFLTFLFRTRVPDARNG